MKIPKPWLLIILSLLLNVSLVISQVPDSSQKQFIYTCDTPADPNGQLVYSTCDYLGTFNPTTMNFKPMINNFMSYYKYCCRNSFIPDQLYAMYLIVVK